jgi:hypothetical protein
MLTDVLYIQRTRKESFSLPGATHLSKKFFISFKNQVAGMASIDPEA